MKITLIQYDRLVQKIYDTLIALPDMGLGEMGECRDTATMIVDEWMKENNIQLLEQIEG